MGANPIARPMKSTTTTEIELTVDDIKEAIKFWLETRSDIEAVDDINFRVEGMSEPDDWRAERALVYELTGAFVVGKPICVK